MVSTRGPVAVEEVYKDDLEPGMGRGPGFFVRQRETVGVGLWSWAVIPFV